MRTECLSVKLLESRLRFLQSLEVAAKPEDMNIAGLRFHSLQGEEMHLSEESLFPPLLEKTPPEERARMATLIKNIWGGPFAGTTYAYDPQGRMVERLQRMGTLSEIRATYHYENREAPILDTTENRSREAGLDENGAVHYAPDRLTLQHNRFEYNYDAQGNWTERVVSYRLEPNPDFQRSNVERRAITYHAA